MKYRSLSKIFMYMVCMIILSAMPVSAESFKELMKRAQKGDALAQFLLARMYQTGEGTAVNKAEAAKWYLKSAEQGYVGSQFLLAQMYKNGDGIPANKPEAAKWYRKAAEQNNSMAQSDLAEMYYKGDGVPQNYAEAAKWYRKAADRNDFNSQFAQYKLAEMYVNGYGVEQNYTEAVNLYRRSAERDFSPANHKLGLMYYNGYGVPKDYAEAMKYLQKAADKGYAPAESSIAAMYYSGEKGRKDEKKSLELLNKAASKGDKKAKDALAAYNTVNSKGTDKAKNKALLQDFLSALVIINSVFDDNSRAKKVGDAVIATGYALSGTTPPKPAAASGTASSHADTGELEEVDVPDFAYFGSDLGFEGVRQSSGCRYYSYFCDVTANKESAQECVDFVKSSYNFVQTDHEYNDGSRVGNRTIGRAARGHGYRIAENWYFRYTGSKYASTCEVGRKNNKHTCHLAVEMARDLSSGITTFRIFVANDLIYGGDDEANPGNTATSIREKPSSSSPLESPRQHKTVQVLCSRCLRRGKIRCSSCNGEGGHFEMIHPTNSGKKKWVSCSKCHGKREIDCPSCNGTGYQTQQLY